MTKPRLIALVIAAASLPLGAQPKDPVPAPLDPASLAVQLRRTIAELDAKDPARVNAGLPQSWECSTHEHEYSISTAPVRSLLASGKNGQAKEWLQQVARQLESYASGPATESGNARQKLDRILARPEFASVHPPSAWDRFRERVGRWIASLLRRLSQLAAQHPAGGQILFWVLVAGLVGALAAWLIRFWTERDEMLHLPPGPAIRPVSCDAWLRAAREAAARGDAREAVRCAYWAAIIRLQEDRVLPADLTRTPREYLHLLAHSRRETQLASDRLEPLTALTRGLERFWYAGQTATLDDYQATLKQLEAIGCKVD